MRSIGFLCILQWAAAGGSKSEAAPSFMLSGVNHERIPSAGKAWQTMDRVGKCQMLNRT